MMNDGEIIHSLLLLVKKDYTPVLKNGAPLMLEKRGVLTYEKQCHLSHFDDVICTCLDEQT